MAEPAEEWVVTHLDVSHLITEDDEAVDNFFQERQMAILTEALRVSWEQGRPFVSGSDVGIFSPVVFLNGCWISGIRCGRFL